MTATFRLGEHFETFIAAQFASGRYADESDVLRDALRLLEDRERRLSAFDSAIELGLADAASGRVLDANTVFDELEAELAAMPDPPKG
jgi:antitoxin ParD1/3/4